jgi:hypothetical protein
VKLAKPDLNGHKNERKVDYANGTAIFVFGKVFQLTLREMQELFTSPRALAVMCIVGLMLGLIGPFNTFEYFRVAPRIAYWLFIVFSCYAVGAFGGGFMVDLLHHMNEKTPLPIIIIAGGFGAGIPVAITVILTNMILIGDWEVDGFGGFMTVVYCVLVSMCIVALHVLFLRDDRPNAPEKPAILDRLQVQNRGALQYLSMQDHYVNVVTSKGKEMLLLRLSDAIKETNGVTGIKIHRSHWVALDAVKSVSRQNGVYQVEMPDGEKLPISRGQIQAAREAGLIPN